MIAFQRKILKQKKVEMEDLGALFYLQYKIFGIDKEYRAKNIVIDEVQDYSEFQLYALKAGLETDMFTLVGDLAQGIHSYRGLQNWQTLQQIIFPRANYMTLQKSYRTTIEIMFLANEILHLLDEDLPKVKPVVRHGEKPTVHLYDQKQALVDKMIELADGLHGEGFHSIAIIGKTEEECKAIFKEMQKRKVPNVQFLQENEELEKNYLIIVPSYLSKGLEFDAVFLFTLNEVFTQEEIDLKLLYVAMTRPMHRLHLFTREKTALLLDKANESHFTVEIAK